MDTDRFRQDFLVATAAAGSSVALALSFQYVLAVEPSFYLQSTPLAVYFLYVFGGTFLPDSINRPRNWAGLAIAIAAVAAAVATL